MDQNDFYTLRGYSRKENPRISASMEDYLEMIYRLIQQNTFVRVNQLASLLNVTPPSASKMVGKLKEAGLVDFEHYGIIQLTSDGETLGQYLLDRHDIIHRFFCTINDTEQELELVEKVEHFIDIRTVENMKKWLEAMRKTPL